MHLNKGLWCLNALFFFELLLLFSTSKVQSQGECFTNGDIRLVGTGLQDMGRVEVCFGGMFGTICDNGWDDADAAIVCSQLGQPFTGATAFTFGGGSESQPIHFDQVNCIGSEVTLISCARDNSVSSQCTHQNDVGVACSAFANDLPVLCPDNISCPGETLPFRCLSEASLCNDFSNCLDNRDESDSSLICSSREFQCNVLNERVPFAALCNGNAECSGGEDEQSEFCTNHCLPPYRGGCQQLNRECVSLRSGPVCGECLGDLVDDPNNPGGVCVPFAVRFIGDTPIVNMTVVTVQFTANLPIATLDCSADDTSVPCQADSQNNIGTVVFDLPPTSSCQVLINITATSVPVAISSPSMVSPFNNLQVGSRLQTFTTPSAMTQNQQTGEFFLFTLLFFIIPGIGGLCTAHVVNHAFVMFGVLQMEYRLVNTLELLESPLSQFSFNCIKDDDSFNPEEQRCGVPITISETAPYSCHFRAGPHTIRIQVDPPEDSLCAFSEIQDHVLSFMIPKTDDNL